MEQVSISWGARAFPMEPVAAGLAPGAEVPIPLADLTSVRSLAVAAPKVAAEWKTCCGRWQVIPRGAAQAPPPKSANLDIEKEITIPFGVAVLGGKHQLRLTRPNGKVESIDIKIPAGLEQAQKIRLKGQGNTGPRGATGDLLVKVKIAAHPKFTRSGLNLSVSVPITLREAAEGAKIDVPTPHGTVCLSVPSGSSSGKSLRLKGMGIRTKKNDSGDLIVTLQIVIPKRCLAQRNRDHSETGWKME